jgi:hypothetical protein
VITTSKFLIGLWIQATPRATRHYRTGRGMVGGEHRFLHSHGVWPTATRLHRAGLRSSWLQTYICAVPYSIFQVQHFTLQRCFNSSLPGRASSTFSYCAGRRWAITTISGAVCIDPCSLIACSITSSNWISFLRILTHLPSPAAGPRAAPYSPYNACARLPHSSPFPRSCTAACSDGPGTRRTSRA